MTVKEFKLTVIRGIPLKGIALIDESFDDAVSLSKARGLVKSTVFLPEASRASEFLFLYTSKLMKDVRPLIFQNTVSPLGQFTSNGHNGDLSALLPASFRSNTGIELKQLGIFANGYPGGLD